jgi:hypothetical protein
MMLAPLKFIYLRGQGAQARGAETYLLRETPQDVEVAKKISWIV